MNVYDISIAVRHENVGMFLNEKIELLFEHTDDNFDFIKETMISKVQARITTRNQLIYTCFGSHEDELYHTNIRNKYERLLKVLHKSCNIDDIRGIEYVSVQYRKVYTSESSSDL